MHRVIIADDHELTRRGLRQVLSETQEFSVVGEAADGNTAWKLITELHPEIALLAIFCCWAW